jgi:type IX secretion system PorP/SprF family membrane protein
MQFKRSILLGCILLLSFIRAFGQDIAFSQFYANPLYLNPALAGSKVCPRMTLNYRNQWPGISNAFVSYSAAADMQVDAIHGGLGVIAHADVAGNGMLSTFSGSAIYSFRLQASRDITLNFALKAGYLQYRLNWDKFIFEDQIDPATGEIKPSGEIPPPRLSIGNMDFSAGFLAGYKERAYIGAAVDHLTTPDYAFYTANNNQLDMRITVHAGALFDLEDGFYGNDMENLSVSPNVVYMQQGKFRQLNTGMYLNMYPFVGGLWFRHAFQNPDALIVLLGIQQPKFKVGYSYDFTLSALGMRSGGAHEVSFAWQFECRKKEFKYKAIKCPRF